MILLAALILLFQPRLSYSTDCEVLPSSFDMDKLGEGQEAFPEEWQRELMALTALSRMDAAGVFSLESGNERSAWQRFRANGVYEALLDMVRITNFTMHNLSRSEGGWSMWGQQYPEAIIFNWGRQDSSGADLHPQYAPYTKLFHRCMEEFGEQSSAAFVMAVRWRIELKDNVDYYSKPFYTIADTVDALTRLRDNATFFKGNLAEGTHLLQKKLLAAVQPSCQREARIAIAFDTYWYSPDNMLSLNRLLDDIIRFTPHATISVRGLSKVGNGFPEGAWLDSVPRIVSDVNQKYFDVLDLVDQSISDIEASESSDEGLRARVILIISKFKSRQSNIQRALKLKDRMKVLSIEPFYFTVETADAKYDDADLMPLLGNETFRGISSGTDTIVTMRMVLPRLLRLICQAPVAIPYGEWKMVRTFSPTTYSIYDRIHLSYDRPAKKGETRYLAFSCATQPNCRFSAFTHSHRYVSEYLHDRSGKNIKVNFQWEFHADILKELHVVLVPKTASLIGIRMFHVKGL